MFFAFFCGQGFLHEVEQCTPLSEMGKLNGAAEDGKTSLSVAHNFKMFQSNKDFLPTTFKPDYKLL